MMHSCRFGQLLAVFTLLATCHCTRGPAAWSGESLQLSEDTWEQAVPEGKEVDAIYGDWVLRNDHLVVVIGEAIESRNANMTVRNVGGSVIDLTDRDTPSDQLSAYYPLGTGYKLSGPTPSSSKPGAPARLNFGGPALDGRSTAEVDYELAEGARSLKITTRVTNTSKEPISIKHSDAIRADGEFQAGVDEELGLFWVYDPYWRQAYGAIFADADWRFARAANGRRSPEVTLEAKNPEQLTLAPGETRELVRYLFPAPNTLAARAWANDVRGKSLVELSLIVSDPEGPVDGAEVTIQSGEDVYGHGVTDAEGHLSARLPVGKYQAFVSAHGRGKKSLVLSLDKKHAANVELPAPGYVVAKVTDVDGKAIACKVQFTGREGTPTPNYGPDSAIHGIRNAYYSENGLFRAPLAPGGYDVIISHGPEYDAVFTDPLPEN